MLQTANITRKLVIPSGLKQHPLAAEIYNLRASIADYKRQIKSLEKEADSLNKKIEKTRYDAPEKQELVSNYWKKVNAADGIRRELTYAQSKLESLVTDTGENGIWETIAHFKKWKAA